MNYIQWFPANIFYCNNLLLSFSRIILLGVIYSKKLPLVNWRSIFREHLDEFAEKKIITFVFYRLYMSAVFLFCCCADNEHSNCLISRRNRQMAEKFCPFSEVYSATLVARHFLAENTKIHLAKQCLILLSLILIGHILVTKTWHLDCAYLGVMSQNCRSRLNHPCLLGKVRLARKERRILWSIS